MKTPAFLAARSKNERIALTALMVLILAVLVVTVFSGGGEEPLDIPVQPTVTRSPTAAPTTSPIPITDTAFGRDPFVPLVREVTSGGAPAAPGEPGPGPSGGTTGGTTSKRVTLVDIFGSGSNRQATVSVDGTEYTVKEGETFDTSFRLLSLTSRCGTFVFGDERFTLCVGQEVRK